MRGRISRMAWRMVVLTVVTGVAVAVPAVALADRPGPGQAHHGRGDCGRSGCGRPAGPHGRACGLPQRSPACPQPVPDAGDTWWLDGDAAGTPAAVPPTEAAGTATPAPAADAGDPTGAAGVAAAGAPGIAGTTGAARAAGTSDAGTGNTGSTGAAGTVDTGNTGGVGDAAPDHNAAATGGAGQPGTIPVPSGTAPQAGTEGATPSPSPQPDAQQLAVDVPADGSRSLAGDLLPVAGFALLGVLVGAGFRVRRQLARVE